MSDEITTRTADLSPAIREKAETYWRFRKAHWTAMARDADDAETNRTGDASTDALIELVSAPAETLADLAEQARALYRESVWPCQHDEMGVQFPLDHFTVPALFKSIERVTGRLVCDNRAEEPADGRA